MRLLEVFTVRSWDPFCGYVGISNVLKVGSGSDVDIFKSSILFFYKNDASTLNRLLNFRLVDYSFLDDITF